MSQISESPIPMTTPASTPTSNVAMIAAIAIPKSKRTTLARRRISATSIIPITTTSMITQPAHASHLEKTSASTKRCAEHHTRVSDAPARAPCRREPRKGSRPARCRVQAVLQRDRRYLVYDQAATAPRR